MRERESEHARVGERQRDRETERQRDRVAALTEKKKMRKNRLLPRFDL